MAAISRTVCPTARFLTFWHGHCLLQSASSLLTSEHDAAEVWAHSTIFPSRFLDASSRGYVWCRLSSATGSRGPSQISLLLRKFGQTFCIFSETGDESAVLGTQIQEACICLSLQCPVVSLGSECRVPGRRPFCWLAVTRTLSTHFLMICYICSGRTGWHLLSLPSFLAGICSGPHPLFFGTHCGPTSSWPTLIFFWPEHVKALSFSSLGFISLCVCSNLSTIVPHVVNSYRESVY